MFRRITQYTLLTFAFLSLIWIFWISKVRQSDVLAYQKAQQNQKVTSSSELISSSTHQTRQGVRKDIWFTQEDGQRLRTRIESSSSVLTIRPKEHNFEVVEELQKIHCWMQDRIYLADGGKPMQQMRYFEADRGTYLYTTQQFLAQSVAISLFRLPGHSLVLDQSPSSAFIRGLAQDVSFSVSGKSPQFQAKNFKAQFSKSPGGV